MTVKVFIAPRFKDKDKGDGGIRRVVEALEKYLPRFGVEVVDTIEEADVIHTHAGHTIEPNGKPILNSSHGIYWSDYDFPDWAMKANEELVQAMSWADAHTAPSKWVANALKRGSYWNPEVVYHGVEADDFAPAEHQGFVLWNKARKDVISDPTPVHELAKRMPDVQFMTTLINGKEDDVIKETPNLGISGVMGYQAMRHLLPYAAVYLATSRETFGIGTLEAMACGVPVAGWDYGGQSEIVIAGQTGYLAPFGDYQKLDECIRLCLRDRERLSANCLADVKARWGWADKIEQYANIYKRLHTENTRKRPRVSVIIPCYNLGKYLPEAVLSVEAQTYKDYELLIIDDQSTDYSWHIAKELEERWPNIKVYRTPENLGLCGTRNYGLSKARGRYIQFLDADDLLTPHALAVCSEVLDHEPGIHIAYGHLDVLNDAGTSASRNDWPLAQFSYYRQMSHLNEPHYSAMVRKSVYDWAGGYRVRHRKAEDAWFWLYATSYGARAEKVTEISTLIWRSRPNSKSIVERENDTDLDGDWTAEFPWALAHSADEANTMIREEGDLVITRKNWEHFPFACQASAPEGYFWDVWMRTEPKTQIVINGMGLVGYNDANWQKLMDVLDPIRLRADQDYHCTVYLPADWPQDIPGANWAEIVRLNSEDAEEIMPDVEATVSV